jgi:hypothetical protein
MKPTDSSGLKIKHKPATTNYHIQMGTSKIESFETHFKPLKHEFFKKYNTADPPLISQIKSKKYIKYKHKHVQQTPYPRTHEPRVQLDSQTWVQTGASNSTFNKQGKATHNVVR